MSDTANPRGDSTQQPHSDPAGRVLGRHRNPPGAVARLRPRLRRRSFAPLPAPAGDWPPSSSSPRSRAGWPRCSAHRPRGHRAAPTAPSPPCCGRCDAHHRRASPSEGLSVSCPDRRRPTDSGPTRSPRGLHVMLRKIDRAAPAQRCPRSCALVHGPVPLGRRRDVVGRRRIEAGAMLEAINVDARLRHARLGASGAGWRS